MSKTKIMTANSSSVILIWVMVAPEPVTGVRLEYTWDGTLLASCYGRTLCSQNVIYRVK